MDKQERTDFGDLSNAELRLYKMELENEFEALKAKAAAIEARMDEIDHEYNKIETEEKIRRTIY